MTRAGTRRRGLEVVAEGENGQEAVELATRTDAANAYAYLVKGCSGGLVLDTIEEAYAAASRRRGSP